MLFIPILLLCITNADVAVDILDVYEAIPNNTDPSDRFDVPNAYPVLNDDGPALLFILIYALSVLERKSASILIVSDSTSITTDSSSFTSILNILLISNINADIYNKLYNRLQ